jgi:hypothetical protein
MLKSSYPPIIRADVLARAGTYKGFRSFSLRQQLAPAQALLDQALALVPAVAVEARGNPDDAHAVYHLGRLLVDTLSMLPEREPPPLLMAFEKVDAGLHNEQVSRVDRLLLDANTSVRLACQARGNKPAVEVTPDGWADFDSNLSRAEELLTEAWQLDANSPEITRLMLCVETGLGRDLHQLDTWFQRAMRVNGDDYFACLAMMEYFAPYWYGSEPEMLSFARTCLKTQNWEGRLPFVLVDAHDIIEADSPSNRVARSRQQPGYYSRPYVWEDIRAVFEPYIAQHPDARVEKSLFARFAALAGQYVLADRLFKELGDGWSPRPTDPEYYKLRDTAAKEAARHRQP